MNTPTDAAATSRAAFFALIRNPLKFRLFLLQKLPAAYFSGLRVVEISEQVCRVGIPYKWFTKNPFRSTYFACLSMAAEMSTGILAMACVHQRRPRISMLVVSIEGKFYKKATGRTEFICKEGAEIGEAVQRAIDLSQAQTIRVLSSGYNKNQELVAEFWITWSF